MIARQLKVYKDAYSLVKLLIDCQMKFSKAFKYTLGTKIQETTLDLFECIQRANMYRHERTKHLEAFLIKFETLKTLLRLACDFNQIDLKRRAAIYDLIEKIGRQISAWKKTACPTDAHSETTDDEDKRLRESTNGRYIR